MKKIISLLSVLIFTITMTLSGCSFTWFKDSVDYSADVISLKAESTLIKAQYLTIYKLVDSNRSSFTDSEIKELEDINFAFTEAAYRVEAMFEDITEVPTPTELKNMYQLAYIGYTNAKDIINKHKEIFTTYQWSQLEAFDKEAISYDAQVRDLLENPDNDDINKMIGMAVTLGGIAYKYLLPVVISSI